MKSADRRKAICALAFCLSAYPAIRLQAQASPLRSAQDVDALALRLAAMTAVSGYERRLADTLLALLPGATRDRVGNVVRTLGAGEPRRLVWCGVDEPGYVVGNVTDDGFLRLRRVGRITSPFFDQQMEGQRVTVFGTRGAVPGVVAVRSTHLARGRSTGGTGDQPFTVDDAWVDLGATARAQIESLGVHLLAPVALTKRPTRYGVDLLAAPAAGRRAACAALLAAAAATPSVQGTVVVGFAAQTLQAGRPGVAALAALHGPFASVHEVMLPAAFPETAVETVSLDSMRAKVTALRAWMSGDTAVVHDHGTPPPATPAPAPASGANAVVRAGVGRLAETQDVLATLVESYGVSGAEGPVRETVQRLLPAWAKPQTDTAGNLWVRVGTGDPLVVIVAHLDEIGFRVDSIRPDGALTLTARGGFYASLFEGKPALVHTGGAAVPGVFVPRDSGTQRTRTPPPLVVSVGTNTAAATLALGVAAGQTVTMPKQYVRLAGTRATGRSFDDRVGSTALVLALRHLDRAKLRHAVAFIWSTREEIGLEGARAAAARLGTSVARVHAVDTFVSADSPLELPTFAVAPLGRGAVARALDNSSVTPLAYLDTLARIARSRGIALQIGTTNGGNDGSAFVPYGVVDVPVGWPLRYSHSPAEVVDLRDVLGLADLVQAVAEVW
jgi:putative aminopeptidase FrvX